jgi:hypothetical protein
MTNGKGTGIFRLLLRAPDPRGADMGTVALAGTRWTVSAYTELPAEEGEVPPFTCVSYSWGRGRVVHPLDAAHSVSDRAIPALETVVAALNPAAIWIDALCIPTEEPARAASLQALGAIYGGAAQVAVVLSRSSAPALEQIRIDERVDLAGLQALEGDGWVSRAWTYQEIANSRATVFVSEGCGGPVEAQDLLNRLGQARSDLKKTEGIDEFELQKRLPMINRLEDTLADYMNASIEQRFAYQAMAEMGQRFAERAEDHFNAMIGAIVSDPSLLAQDPSLPPAERFRQACETRRDYSFIYSVAPRSEEAGKSWRPAGESMPVVLSWHTYGNGQMGELRPTHLRLEGMYTPQRGALQPEAVRYIRQRLAIKETIVPADDLARAIFERLATMGCNGSSDPIETETGYFFPQTRLTGADGMCIAVAAGVQWAFGAPGLVLEDGRGAICRFRDVGVFVGQVPQGGEPIDVA